MVFKVIQFSQFFSSFISISTLASTIYIKLSINQFQIRFNEGFSRRAALYPARSQKIEGKVMRGCHKLFKFVKVKNLINVKLILL